MMFLGKSSLFLLIFYSILERLNTWINEFEVKRAAVKNIFKYNDVNNTLMKKIRLIQENFNEVEYKANPDFNFKREQPITTVSSPNIGVETKDIETRELVEIGEEKGGKNFQIIIKKSDERKSNNDPLRFKDFNNYVKFLESNDEKAKIAKEEGFDLSIYDIYCRCLKDDKQRIKQEYFIGAIYMYDYYLDITTFFKKMMEVDIIKYYLFTRSERQLISIMSNPDFSVGNEEIKGKLEMQYQKFDKTNGIDAMLADVVEEARNRSGFNKLIQLIQNGNSNILDY